MKRVIPTEIRQLNADIAFLGLKQSEISRRSGVSTYDISRILGGWLNHPAKLGKIRRVVSKAKAEGVAA